MVSDQLPSKPGAISSARAVQASLPATTTGRDDFRATVAARSVPEATEPPVMAAPPPITLFPAGQRSAASFGLTELLRLASVTVSSPLTPDGPVAPVDPAGPVDPVAPVAPVAPMGPVGPVRL